MGEQTDKVSTTIELNARHLIHTRPWIVIRPRFSEIIRASYLISSLGIKGTRLGNAPRATNLGFYSKLRRRHLYLQRDYSSPGRKNSLKYFSFDHPTGD